MISEEYLYAIALRECSQIGDINFQSLFRLSEVLRKPGKKQKRL
jgi:DNA processing protein